MFQKLVLSVMQARARGLLEHSKAALVGIDNNVGGLVSRGGEERERARLLSKGVDLEQPTAHIRMIYSSHYERVRKEITLLILIEFS